ncbi:MAG: hypothetical protein A2W31_11360 [Planctomycetes bacterium RBG_16_64_10]|nr:MAG: hypothetical protein A2W31_11360 [Planctomycetes bacterium RBG_16_64_10]
MPLPQGVARLGQRCGHGAGCKVTVHEWIDKAAIAGSRQCRKPWREVGWSVPGQLRDALGMLPGIEKQEPLAGDRNGLLNGRPTSLQVIRRQGDAKPRRLTEVDQGLE